VFGVAATGAVIVSSHCHFTSAVILPNRTIPDLLAGMKGAAARPTRGGAASADFEQRGRH